MHDRIVLTGGPCAGKTTALAYLSAKLSDRGFHPLIVPEAATLLMLGNATPHLYPEKVFQRGVMTLIHGLESVWDAFAQARPELRPILICDRGISDCPPYMEPATYEDLLAELRLGTALEVRDGRYKGVFHMRTAAIGAEAHYTNANNQARRETLAEARERDRKTLEAWIGHPHLRVIENTTDFEGKLRQLDKEICALLGIPVPLEIERKYRCAPIAFCDIPVPCQRIEIEQVYLRPADGRQVRVRKRGQHGSFVYYQTVKRELRPGVRMETEDLITADDYLQSLELRDPASKPLRKERWCFVWDGQYFELDRIPTPAGKEYLYLLELELTEEQQVPRLPPFLSVLEDVTHDPAYTNYRLALVA
jgi:CYTH domain-containing protein